MGPAGGSPLIQCTLSAMSVPFSRSNRFLDFFYGADGRISAVQDHTGRTVQYVYDWNEIVWGRSFGFRQLHGGEGGG